MERFALSRMKEWKENENRKPLIIRGARQVGKTWIMKTFGQQYFEKTAYVNFDNNARMKQVFEGDLDIERLVLSISAETGVSIEAENTLIIFDEVQEVPKALTSLKYFYENAPQYHIICAGSLLGVALHRGTSFPVGKIDFLKLYPLTFKEFLLATGNENFLKLIEKNDYSMIKVFREKFIETLKHYYFVGGMPECVSNFSQNKDFNEVRNIQQRILLAYEQDFSKHAPHKIVPRLRMLWNSIPSQLARENKKFIYGIVREGARAKEYEMALMWLIDCGLVHKISRVVTPKLPLKAYEDLKAFKLFMLDTGLLTCMTGLNQSTLIDGNNLFTEFKGALTEQYVLQQFVAIDNLNIYYYTNSRGSCEIDFLIDNGENIIPVEVKAELNLKAKSLKVYKEKYTPEISVRISMNDYNKEEWLLNLPLYVAGEIEKIIKEETMSRY